jgi:hypothetical protein
VRVLEHMQSSDKPHKSWVLQLGAGAALKWCGLALARMTNTVMLALTTDTSSGEASHIHTFNLDESMASGIPFQTFRDPSLAFSRGICFTKRLDALLVACGRHIKEVSLENGTVSVWPADFKNAVDVAVDLDGNVAVADQRASTVSLYDCNRALVVVWGSGSPGNVDGPFKSARFDEPVGLAFLGTTAVVATYGGNKSGHISLVTGTEFGANIMEAIDALYLAIGYMPRRLPVADREQRILPIDIAVEKVRDSANFFTTVVVARKATVGRVPQGPEGSFSA